MTDSQTYRRTIWALLFAFCFLWQNDASAENENYHYISASKLSLIGAASGATLGLGYLVSRIDSTTTAIFSGPLPGEAGFQRALGGKYYPDKSNFLDGSFGSAITPGVIGITMVIADATWPRRDPWKDAGEDVALYISGLAATKGVTSLAKGLFARPRPLIALEPELAGQRKKVEGGDDRKSFFSGHSSSAFFAATFVNHRLRDILRQRLSTAEYRDWRWLPPVALFSWGTFVSWSRIHAYKHYLSDVIVGSLVGYLVGELFYSLMDDINPRGIGESSASHLVTLRISF